MLLMSCVKNFPIISIIHSLFVFVFVFVVVVFVVVVVVVVVVHLILTLIGVFVLNRCQG